MVDEAAKLAQTVGGTVALLHIARVPQVTTDFATESASIAELTLAIEQDADRQLGEIKDRLQQRGVAVESLRSTGSPVAEILGQAKTLSADYIVMGSHGHTAFYALVIGGTTSAVMKKARCPVIIVPVLKRAVASTPREEPNFAGALAKS